MAEKIELVYNATAAREKSISKRKLYDMGGGWGGSPSKCSGVFYWLLMYPQLYCQNISLFGKLFIDHKVRFLLFIFMQNSANLL